MKKITLTSFALIAWIASNSQDCSELLKWGIYNTVNQSTTSATFISNVSDFVTKYESSTNKQDSKSAAVSIFGLGSAGGNYTDIELKQLYEEAKAFSSNQFSSAAGTSFYNRFVDPSIVASYTQCVAMANKNVKIEFKPNEDLSSISLKLYNTIGPGQTASKLNRVSVSGFGKIRANKTTNVKAGVYEGGDNPLETSTEISSSIWSWSFSRVSETNTPGIKYKSLQVAFTVSTDLFILNLPQVRDVNYIKPHVGEIVVSMLDVATFKRINDVAGKIKWVLADGNPCPNSDYFTLDPVKHKSVPDLQGVFLRGKNYNRDKTQGNADGDLELGAYQGFSTHMPQVPFIISGRGEHDHTINEFKPLQDPFIPPSANYDNGDFSGIARADASHDGSLQLSIKPGEGGHGHSIAGGDSETRPSCVTVNYFICIDSH